jgi:hypothetical protein
MAEGVAECHSLDNRLRRIPMLVLNILIGIALLLLGRKIFWLFVAGIGFVVAMDLVTRLFAGPQVETITPIALVAGLVAGVLGALLAIFLQRVAVGIVGFLAGGYIVLSFLEIIGAGEMAALSWVLAFVGGILGLVLALVLLEWALIVLSSLSGAGLIAQSAGLNRPLAVLVFVVALIVGIVVQGRMLSRDVA